MPFVSFAEVNRLILKVRSRLEHTPNTSPLYFIADYLATNKKEGDRTVELLDILNLIENQKQ